MKEKIEFILNENPVSIEVNGNRDLLWVLRTEFAFTGTKCGCGEGICGACTVLVDGEALQSCQIKMNDIKGSEVTTIEGLEKNGKLHPLQEFFIEHDALQCGFCTPGMIMKSYGLLLDNPKITKDEIKDGLEDNLCRCGAHVRIIDAVEVASKKMNGGK